MPMVAILRGVILFFFIVGVVACSNNDDSPQPTQPLPTLINLGEAATSIPESPSPNATIGAQPTDVLPSATPDEGSDEGGNEPTETPAETNTPAPTIPPARTQTPDQTRVFELALTATAQQTPRIATLTPVVIAPDAGGNTTTTQPPLVQMAAADVIITESQFQAGLDQRLPDIPEIGAVVVDFVPGGNQGIRIEMFASGGQAMINGNVFIAFQSSGGRLLISIIEVTVGAVQAPQAYAEIAQNQLFDLIVSTFDGILNERLGEQHDLETITINETTMDIMLLVPQ